jgi:uncharacterized Fe-S cluster-containing MiaB family protein
MLRAAGGVGIVRTADDLVQTAMSNPTSITLQETVLQNLFADGAYRPVVTWMLL